MHAIARAHRNRADFEDAEGLQGRYVLSFTLILALGIRRHSLVVDVLRRRLSTWMLVGAHSSVYMVPTPTKTKTSTNAFPFPTEFSLNPTIPSHLTALYDTLLDQSLLQIVEPCLVVEIEYVAQVVGRGGRLSRQSECRFAIRYSM